MRIGIAYDLKADVARRVAASAVASSTPEDALEEYDSEATVDAIAAAIESQGHQPLKLGGGRELIERLLAERPDLVFNIAEGWGSRSREAHVPAVLEMLGVPVTHSDPLTCVVTLDKAAAKAIVTAAGVPTPRWRVAETPGANYAAGLEFPLIAKPLGEGSSVGVRKSSRCDNATALRSVVERLLADYRQPVLIEEFCAGPEFTVGVLGHGAAARVLGVMEIVPRLTGVERFVYSLEVKRNYKEEVEYHVPPRRPAAELHAIETVALDAYRALGCRDIARVDVRMNAAHQPHFIEVNPLPGLHPVTGDIVIIAARMGVDYPRLIGAVIDHARTRYGI